MAADRRVALEKKAEIGDPFALDTLFLARLFGFGGSMDLAKARETLVAGFRAGGPVCLLYQGRCLKGFWMGDTLSPSLAQKTAGKALVEKTGRVFIPLAKDGSPPVRFLAGLVCLESGDEKAGLRWLSESAQGGFAPAYLEAASWVLAKAAPDRDETESLRAVGWLRKAADQGFAPAWTRLGHCHLEGRYDTERSPEKAVELFRKAAEAGDAEAERRLGMCYFEGKGVTKDRREALQWFLKGADHQDTPSMLRQA
jgi:TPR repeat protein